MWITVFIHFFIHRLWMKKCGRNGLIHWFIHIVHILVCGLRGLHSSKRVGCFVDCDKTAKNDGVWQKNAGVFKIGNHLKYTEYSENFS